MPPKVTICYNNNKGLLDLAKNAVFHTRMKHVELMYRFIIEVVEKGIVEVERVGIQDMLADGFNKPLVKDTFKNYRERIVTVTLAVTRFAPGSADYDYDEWQT